MIPIDIVSRSALFAALLALALPAAAQPAGITPVDLPASAPPPAPPGAMPDQLDDAEAARAAYNRAEAEKAQARIRALQAQRAAVADAEAARQHANAELRRAHDAEVAAVLETARVLDADGTERIVPAAEFFIGPALDIRHMTALRPGEILTAVRIPSTWRGATFYFEKVADRATWDFALLSVAAAFKLDGETIAGARIVCGAVACVPWRLEAVERQITGRARNEETATQAGKLAVEGARTLNFNHFKIPLMENLVRRAIRDA